jgi:two-component system, LytTR family, sensor kinase
MELVENRAPNPRAADLEPADTTLRIEDIVDLHILQRIQDTFAKAMGVAAVTVDRGGRPVTRASNFQPICQLIRSTRTGLARCQECDARGGMAAYASGRPETYVCMGGLMDVAAPIIIENEYLGCILCGQVVLSEDRERFIEDIIARNRSLGLPRQQLQDAVQRIPALPRDRLDAAVEMLMLTANHIIEIGMTNVIQARLLREAEEKAAIQAALRDAQIRALQAQINPHFLFNSLTLVSYTALAEGAAQTEEIAYTLSDLLRYSLRNTATMVPLGEEIQMIERYLTLQQMRFGDRLKTHIELDAALRDLHVPCMLLQPLVENAVVHAVEPLRHTVIVRVTATRRGKTVVLEVADDGPGMEPAQVNALNAHQALPVANRQRPSLGLQSVIRRLEGEYGDSFDIHVESAPGRGSRILLSWAIDDAFVDQCLALTNLKLMQAV